jgi:hypothetical protein
MTEIDAAPEFGNGRFCKFRSSKSNKSPSITGHLMLVSSAAIHSHFSLDFTAIFTFGGTRKGAGTVMDAIRKKIKTLPFSGHSGRKQLFTFFRVSDLKVHERKNYVYEIPGNSISGHQSTHSKNKFQA